MFSIYVLIILKHCGEMISIPLPKSIDVVEITFRGQGVRNHSFENTPARLKDIDGHEPNKKHNYI